MRYDLTPLRNVLKANGSPEKEIPPSIHVAGTNGKGSTVAFLVAGFTKLGFRVGAYTSPHVDDYNERIAVNGHSVSKKIYASFYQKAVDMAKTTKLTEFELITLAAILYFSQSSVDLVIWETGLGGRLDATNVITPNVSVITPISMDHMDYLGETVEAIAQEKAGIIKEGVPAFSTPQDYVVWEVLRKDALSKNTRLLKSNDLKKIPEQSVMKGEFQKVNRGLALTVGKFAMENYDMLGVKGSDKVTNQSTEAMEQLFNEGMDSASLFGRYQKINLNDCMSVIDAAHNLDGLVGLFTAMLMDQEMSGDIDVVIGLSKPSDRREILERCVEFQTEWERDKNGRVQWSYCQFDEKLSWHFDAVKSYFTGVDVKSVDLDDAKSLPWLGQTVVTGSIYFISHFSFLV